LPCRSEKPLPFLRGAAERIARLLNIFGVAMGLIMVLIVTANVIGRYLFRRPLIGTVEVEEFMLLVLVFFGIGYAQIKKRHVSITTLVDRLPRKAQLVINNVTFLPSLIAFSLITWQSLVMAETYRSKGVSSLFLEVPLWPFLWVLAIGTGVFCLALLSDFIFSAKEVLENGKFLWIWATAGNLIIMGIVLVAFHHKGSWSAAPRALGMMIIGMLIVLLFSKTLISSALALAGFFGMTFLSGVKSGLGLMGTVPYSTTANYSMCVIPFFLLMGELAYHAGLSRSLYHAAYKWLGHMRGGLAMATVTACGGFAAVSGSSLATAATMGTVALPEMKRYNYAPSLAVGCVAAGGTIGILIPPSTILIIYGILTEQSISKLFFAGFLPGVLSVIYYVVVIYIVTLINPRLGPPGSRASFGEKWASIKSTWLVLALFMLIMGGLYRGIFTPTEAGAIGASAVLGISLLSIRLTWRNIISSLLGTGETTAMVFAILIGTTIFGRFLAATKLPMELANFVIGLQVAPWVVLGIIIVFYFFFGCIMGTLPMIVLTVPIFFPVIQALGYDPIWFGIVIVMVSEIGLITPPVGMNVFIIKGVAKDIPLSTIFRGIFPFLGADIARLVTIVIFPQIALFLPNLLK
jgi:C4-dicarboxylate transporter DctM subunit